MIDVEAESVALRERSAALAAQLDAAYPVVDRTKIRAAQAESARLGAAANEARDAVVERVKRGEDPGCVLGPKPPIRRVQTDAKGRDLDGVLRGRSAFTTELLAYWQHRRDVVGPTIVETFSRAAEARKASPALLAAVREHLDLVRRRGYFALEGGQELQAALGRYESARGTLRAEMNEGQAIISEAGQRLDQLRGGAMLAQVQDQTDFDLTWMAGRISQALGGEPVDVKTGRPIGSKTTK